MYCPCAKRCLGGKRDAAHHRVGGVCDRRLGAVGVGLDGSQVAVVGCGRHGCGQRTLRPSRVHHWELVLVWCVGTFDGLANASSYQLEKV